MKSSSLPEQEVVLTNLLIDVKCKIWSLHKAEVTHKQLLRMKKAKSEFKVNPYKAGKNRLDPKCYCSAKLVQESLDQHKSLSPFDKNYDILLANLEGLPPEF